MVAAQGPPLVVPPPVGPGLPAAGPGSKGERGYDWQCLVLTEAADADMGYHLPFRHSSVPTRS